jgi:hypothetical protein
MQQGPVLGGAGRDLMTQQCYPSPTAAATLAAPPLDEQLLPNQRQCPWLLWAGLILAVLLVYQPAWRGGILWDDD